MMSYSVVFDICGVFASTHHPGGQLERVGGEIVGVKGVNIHWECHYSEFFWGGY